MPELPEVETIRRQLEPRLVGSTFIDAESHWSAKFTAAVDAIGDEVTAVRRRGKYLIIEAESENEHDLIIHLGMTGRLAVHATIDTSHPHLRAWWQLDDGRRLTFHDPRRFGRVYFVDRGEWSAIATLSALGPEPFGDDFTAAHLHAALAASSRHIKTQLLSQRPVAGVGNIYADEALWLAEINPAARSISKPRADRLFETIRESLRSGVENGGTTLRDYVDSEGRSGSNQHRLHCYGRSGEPCERCGTVLRKRELDARGTTWCPACQKR